MSNLSSSGYEISAILKRVFFSFNLASLFQYPIVGLNTFIQDDKI